MVEYVDAKDFKDFKDSFSVMISVFNHSVSEIRENSKKTSKEVKAISDTLGNVKTDLAVVKEKSENNNWMIKWIFGIIAVIVAGGIVGAIINGGF